jgi:signal transduction histidine kinase/ligand-binding sensor domain-containing protein/CheY-like chemotaxis protein
MMMRWLRFMLWMAMPMAAAAPALAALVETPQFQALGSAEGLPSETVYALAQDGDGFIWVGTGDGLARYDGIEFVVFRHRPDAADSLPSNIVQALHVDAAGRVWVGTEGGGLSMLAPGAAGFRHFRPGVTEGMALEDVWSITSGPDGALWFGGFGGGLYRLDPGTDALQVFRHRADDPASLSSDHVLAIAVDAGGQVWVAGTQGLDRYDAGSFRRHPPGPEGPRAGLVFSLTADPDGGMWIGSAAGLDHRDADGTMRHAGEGEGLSEPGVTALLRDAPDSLWLATRSGLHHRQQGMLRRYPTPSPRQSGSEASSLLDMLRDHEGGLWFASVGGGLLRLPPNWRDFSVLRSDRHRDDSLSAAVPRGMAAAGDGKLWVVGKGSGLDRVDIRDGRVERLFSAPDALPDRRLHSVLQGRDGVVWIGHHLGLSRYDPVSGAVQSFISGTGEDAPPGGPVDLLLADPVEGFWLSAYGGGIEHRDAKGRLIDRFLPGGGGGLPSADIEQMAFGPDGGLWLAGSFGLARRDATGGDFSVVDGAPDDRVRSFDFDADGMLWAHRLGALERFALTPAGIELRQQVTAVEGLPAVESGALLVDSAGTVWLTSRRGLLRYQPSRGEFRDYGVRDGLFNQEFNDRPALRLDDGSIVAGTLDGLVMFDPAALFESSIRSPLRLHRVSVQRNGQRVELDPRQPLQLEPNDRELQVTARLMSFVAPAPHRFRFRLHGFDEDWADGAARGERTYSRLPPGEYRLQVEASGPGGIAAAPIELGVAVAPHWWQTLPARLAQFTMLLAALAGAWRWQRHRQARRHAADLAERERQWALQASDAKSQFLATLGHEIRTPMTGVLGMTELLLRSELQPRQRAHAQAIQRSGGLMLRLLNDALDLARIEAGRLPLDARAFDLQRCLEEVAAQQRPLAEAKGLAFDVDIDPVVAAWRTGDPLRLQQVLLNLVGNAIKFTEQGSVSLRLCAHAEGFELQVADTGPGLNDAQRARLFRRFEQIERAPGGRRHGGSGLGLAISQELVSAMGGRIVVDSVPGVGSCFRVQLDLPMVPPDTLAVAPDIPAVRSPPCEGQRVLLVEDDALVAEVTTELLRAHGFDVSHAAHGLAALAELATQDFDAAVLDLDLPGIDGLELARLLRAQRHALPLLALTARADLAAEPEAIAAGFDHFLRKPVDGETLAGTLAALCERVPAATLAD